MVGFYKHDIPDWMDGTEALSDGAYRAYHVICQLIHLSMLSKGRVEVLLDFMGREAKVQMRATELQRLDAAE